MESDSHYSLLACGLPCFELFKVDVPFVPAALNPSPSKCLALVVVPKVLTSPTHLHMEFLEEEERKKDSDMVDNPENCASPPAITPLVYRNRMAGICNQKPSHLPPTLHFFYENFVLCQ